MFERRQWLLCLCLDWLPRRFALREKALALFELVRAE